MNAKRGLLAILSATAVAGILGYAVQITVPIWLNDTKQYIQFASFWSVTFLLVSMVSGMQQEITRATGKFTSQTLISPPHVNGSFRKSMSIIALNLSIGAVFVVVFLSVFAGEKLFDAHTLSMTIAMFIAVIGYIAVALISGVFYGAEAYGLAAMTTGVDAFLRFLIVFSAAALGLGVDVLAFGVAIPFGVTAIFMWLVSRNKFKHQLHLDTTASKILFNGIQVMLAALASGALISGLPAMLAVISTGIRVDTLASIVLTLTLTRAPLVIPLLALQSFLVVNYQKLGLKSKQRASALFLVILATSVLIAGVGWLVGPGAMKLVYGTSFVLSNESFFLIVLSGGTTAALAAISPVLLARNKHLHYLLSWAISVAVTLIGLFLAAESVPISLLAIVLGPVVGCIYVFIFIHKGSQIPDPETRSVNS